VSDWLKEVLRKLAVLRERIEREIARRDRLSGTSGGVGTGKG